MDEDIPNWKERSDKFKTQAQPIIEALENGEDVESNPILKVSLDEINKQSEILKNELKERVLFWQNKGKKVVLLGGDHSTPLGYYEALTSIHDSFGILHLDAHMDLRNAYEGFTYSHASIMYNALKLPELSKLVQVGIRDFCEEEHQVVKNQGERVT